jgi:diguanylate cyclase (GGDEF)-like protein
MQQEFVLGDRVRMNVGGPVMTVDGTTSEGKIICAWFEGDRPRNRDCWPSQLILMGNESDDVADGEVDAFGLRVRKAFDRELTRSVTALDYQKEPLALVMIDLDKFKLVNDRHGHPAGDEVLRTVGELVTSVTGVKGKCYRYGGEELVILLPNYDSNEAAALAERIRKLIESTSIGEKNLSVTASFGVAHIPDHAATAESLLSAADSALYRAKESGRNVVLVSGESTESPSTPRLPVRKLPSGNSVSDKEVEAIRTEYFRNGSAKCPRDGSVLRIQEFASDETVAPTLVISCPFCGLHERHEGLVSRSVAVGESFAN